MATFVLIHGACHGAWCWEKLVPLLEARGHKVVAPDLPGSGEDRTTPVSAVTLSAYVNAVSKLLDKEDCGDENVMGAVMNYAKQGVLINYLGKDVNVEFSPPGGC